VLGVGPLFLTFEREQNPPGAPQSE
jgi:hypothetical protein